MPEGPARARESGVTTVVVARLWDYLLLATLLVGLAGLLLVGALALGANSPRPRGVPDWEAPQLPRQIDVASDDSSVSILGDRSGDFTLEVLAEPIDGRGLRTCEYGVVYRAQDEANYYAFVIGADGYYAVARVQEGRTTLLAPWQQFPHIRRNQQANRMLITCSGVSCEFRLNDEYVVKVDDGTWTAGGVGIMARAPEAEATVRFLYARLWGSDG